MKNSLLYAGLATGIFLASCTGNNASLVPSGGANAPAAFGAPPFAQGANERVPAGWSATATHAVTLKDFPTARVPDTTRLHVVVGLRMRDADGAKNLLREQHAPGGRLLSQMADAARVYRQIQSVARRGELRRRVSPAGGL